MQTWSEYNKKYTKELLRKSKKDIVNFFYLNFFIGDSSFSSINGKRGYCFQQNIFMLRRSKTIGEKYF